MNLKQVKKKGNKGFSLVELIIVIAIMAILVGGLAPAYLKYVEKSKKSSDVQAIDSVLTAMKTVAMDPEAGLTEGAKLTVTISSDGLKVDTDTAKGDLKAILGDYKLKGSWKVGNNEESTKIEIVGTYKNGEMTFSCEQRDALNEYSKDLASQFKEDDGNSKNETDSPETNE